MTPLGNTIEKEKANTIINKGTKDYQEDLKEAKSTDINKNMQQG